MAHTKFRTVLLAVLFVGMICFPLLNEIFGWVDDIPSSEKRAFAEKPSLNINSLDPFPSRYEAFYNDHFNLRFRLIDLYSQMQFRLFKVSPIPKLALLGKEDWFFFAGNEQDAYLGQHRITPAELDSFKLELSYRQQYVERMGGKFYFVICPVKNNIYTEYQPTTAYPLYPDSWGEQILNHLQAHTSVNAINVFDTLRRHRKEVLLYYKRDNHWTPYGAFLVANAILERIHQDFPAVTPNRPEDFEFQETDITVGNVADMFGMKHLIIDTTDAFVPKAGWKAKDVKKVPYPPYEDFAYPHDYEHNKETGDSTKPKLLLITDSFGHNIFPYFAEHFRRSVKIFDSWQYMLNESIIQAERPDVVLIMPMEANLRFLLDHQSHLGVK